MALIERYQELSVASLLAHRATADPQRTFLIQDAERVTFSEVDQDAEALAAAFHNLGVGSGDRIAVILPPCREFVASVLAAAKLGAVVVPLDPSQTTGELQYMLRHSQVVAAVIVETFRGVQYLEIFEELIDQLPELNYLVTVGDEELWYDNQIFQYEDMISAGKGRDYPLLQGDPADEVFALLYTSGTTGKPKGVLVTNRNLVTTAGGTAIRLGLTENDRVIGFDSLAHAFGIAPGILGALISGASLVLHKELTPETALDLIEGHRVTVEYGTPTLLAHQLISLGEEQRDVSSLRLVLVAGGPLADGAAEEIESSFGAPVVVGYSMTEAASTVTLSSPEDSAERRQTTAGTPIDGVEIRIVEGDVELPVESLGEVLVRGPSLMSAYYRKPKETANRIDGEGFFRTGDLGMLDDSGALHLVGRRDDVIIRTGFNVYPREVEDRLHAHPAVLEAALIGLSDEVLGEATCACLILEEGALVTDDEIRDWCRASLAEPKVPDMVRFLEQLPRGSSGEVRRSELRRLISSEG